MLYLNGFSLFVNISRLAVIGGMVFWSLCSEFLLGRRMFKSRPSKVHMKQNILNFGI